MTRSLASDMENWSSCTWDRKLKRRSFREKGIEDGVVVHVHYLYCHSYYGVQGYSEKRGRGESGSTMSCTVPVLP